MTTKIFLASFSFRECRAHAQVSHSRMQRCSQRPRTWKTGHHVFGSVLGQVADIVDDQGARGVAGSDREAALIAQDGAGRHIFDPKEPARGRHQRVDPGRHRADAMAQSEWDRIGAMPPDVSEQLLGQASNPTGRGADFRFAAPESTVLLARAKNLGDRVWRPALHGERVAWDHDRMLAKCG